MNFAATPRLPRALLHQLKVYERTFVRDGPGGQSRPVEKAVKTFKGIVMPLSNKDLKDLPEGTYTENSQKLYSDDPVEVSTNQIIEDTFDGQRYTVKTSLGHNSIHPMVRYIVEGVVKKGRSSKPVTLLCPALKSTSDVLLSCLTR